MLSSFAFRSGGMFNAGQVDEYGYPIGSYDESAEAADTDEEVTDMGLRGECLDVHLVDCPERRSRKIDQNLALPPKRLVGLSFLGFMFSVAVVTKFHAKRNNLLFG